MEPEDRDLSDSSQEVAGCHRSLRHLFKSPILSVFFSIPRPERSGHGCSAPDVEWVAGVCFYSLVSHSCSVEEAPVFLWSSPDHHCSLLASETLVSRASGSSEDGPIPLPLSRDLLRQPHFHRHHLGVSGLSLHVWRLSSDLPGLRVFSSNVAGRPLWLEGLLLALAVRRNGQYIGCGAC